MAAMYELSREMTAHASIQEGMLRVVDGQLEIWHNPQTLITLMGTSKSENLKANLETV